ncbi:MAG TPA: thiamine-phosphate kinase [Blastocatellia bacterium]|nr:thiamine-phosphate kinase [Blastocatellia bacterium]
MRSEFDFIDRIRRQAARQHNSETILGIGDDAAVLREQTGRETLVTADLLVEGIDFKRAYIPPAWLGHRALAVSLSDIAAMGGTPRSSLLTLAIPKSDPPSEEFWEEFLAGYFALAEQHGVTLIGGDISSTPDCLTIDSHVMGHCRAGQAVRRSGARVGDSIYVTGTIGASAAGLRLLLEGARVDPEDGHQLRQRALRTHLRPEPRVEFGRLIGEDRLAHSMIDVSDGLGQDLAHICEESRGRALIEYDLVPIAEEARMVAESEEAAFALAMGGGEDFELILTADAAGEARLMKIASDCGVRLTRIGKIVEAHGQLATETVAVRRDGEIRPLTIRGFDHLAI